jgi:hypothetical protein
MGRKVARRSARESREKGGKKRGRKRERRKHGGESRFKIKGGTRANGRTQFADFPARGRFIHESAAHYDVCFCLFARIRY